MRKTGLLALSLVLAIFAAQDASAAVVSFSGRFVNQTLPLGGGAGSALGTVPPAITFTMQLTVTDGSGAAPGGAPVTGGFVTVGGDTSAIVVNSGSAILTENGADDTIQFVVNVANGGGADNGQWTFNFSGGDYLVDTTVGATTFSGRDGSIMREKISTSVTYLDFGNGQVSSYTGTITAVPEPSSMALMVGLVAGVAGWRRRRA